MGTWQIYHLEGTKLITDFLTKAIAVKTAWQRFRKFIRMADLAEKDIAQEAEVPEGENDGGVRLAKVALCLASCADFSGWPSQIVKVAVVASLSVALAAEAIRVFGKKRVNAGDSKPRVFQNQYNHSNSGGESLVATRPKLCTLRAGLAREQKDQERSQQKEKEKE